MDENGEVREAVHVEKNTAEKHTAAPPDKEVDEVTELFKGLGKKKKSKKPKDAEGEEGGAGGEEATPAADGELDLSTVKKKKKKSKDAEAEEGGAGGEEGAPADGELDLSTLKKKKKKPKKADVGDFEAKLAEAGVTEEGAQEKGGQEELPEGDLEAGTGIWAHDATQPIPYQFLVTRFFSLIQSHHPDLLSSGSKSYRIPPPQCLREGNRRTIFANISDICKRMKRSDDHVMQFLFAELGTSGSVDGSRRLVIKGRFQQKQIENVLRRYIVEYVTCKTCRSPDTELNKGENRLYFVTCNSCGSRRSVTAIKTGFRGQVSRRKKAQ
ncbi:Translational initiation factor 2 beta [Rasamsonia emersonii CBS 393.64]|uniref:Translational initiation factor 2 beta n=1 Tax=Rasamsonia emersonii (strain ATCC 16479 / CBS 393.64 / IMI 116815) TaxID=1408163 RepID=A0A0F4YFB2_RASE3|nr:Translational initiation factor 2 beta [Rasamsonia emersonii CBS 393.64]KKA16932.1 Translational initiation factor 2 beta [Rasamsonia emersonii CBS 393.64]